jgi:hypothetical protein
MKRLEQLARTLLWFYGLPADHSSVRRLTRLLKENL